MWSGRYSNLNDWSRIAPLVIETDEKSKHQRWDISWFNHVVVPSAPMIPCSSNLENIEGQYGNQDLFESGETETETAKVGQGDDVFAEMPKTSTRDIQNLLY